jgi:hypothetical protein
MKLSWEPRQGERWEGLLPGLRLLVARVTRVRWRAAVYPDPGSVLAKYAECYGFVSLADAQRWAEETANRKPFAGVEK